MFISRNAAYFNNWQEKRCINCLVVLFIVVMLFHALPFHYILLSFWHFSISLSPSSSLFLFHFFLFLSSFNLLSIPLQFFFSFLFYLPSFLIFHSCLSAPLYLNHFYYHSSYLQCKPFVSFSLQSISHFPLKMYTFPMKCILDSIIRANCMHLHQDNAAICCIYHLNLTFVVVVDVSHPTTTAQRIINPFGQKLPFFTLFSLSSNCGRNRRHCCYHFMCIYHHCIRISCSILTSIVDAAEGSLVLLLIMEGICYPH